MEASSLRKTIYFKTSHGQTILTPTIIIQITPVNYNFMQTRKDTQGLKRTYKNWAHKFTFTQEKRHKMRRTKLINFVKQLALSQPGWLASLRIQKEEYKSHTMENYIIPTAIIPPDKPLKNIILNSYIIKGTFFGKEGNQNEIFYCYINKNLLCQANILVTPTNAKQL